MRPAIPSLMHFYPGFKPWEIDRFTNGELQELLKQLPTKES